MTDTEKYRIINGNINELRQKKLSCDERLYVHYRDKMALMANADFDSLPHIFSESTADEDEATKMLCADILCKLVFGSKPETERFLPIYRGKKKDAIIAYFDNPASAEALCEFEKIFDGSRSDAYFDFESVCEAVYNSKADACILPLENSSDGRLTGFYNLAAKYELFTVAVADVTNYDTSVRTRFSLMSSHPVLYAKSDKLSCVIQFDLNPDMSIAFVIACADFFGLYCSAADCIPEPHITTDCKGVFKLEGDNMKIFSFLFYLHLCSVPYILQGMYDKI